MQVRTSSRPSSQRRSTSTVSAGVAERLTGLAGFRNVLVHDYARLDLRRVHAGLERLGDLEAFVADVERWLEGEADENERAIVTPTARSFEGVRQRSSLRE